MTGSDPLVAAIGDNGSLTFWDYNTGTPFQNMEDIPQPGSLEAEAGVFCSTFDQTGTRLITGGADKTIKVRVLPFMLRLIQPFSRSNLKTLRSLLYIVSIPFYRIRYWSFFSSAPWLSVGDYSLVLSSDLISPLF